MTAVPPPATVGLSRAAILAWLRERDETQLAALWQAADETRRRYVGDEVHLRGLIEISNHCARQCAYCGLRAGNRSLERYRMTSAEVLECARRAQQLGYGTVVLQAGDDPGLARDWLADLVRSIKRETGLAVTLSLGERSVADMRAWRTAGADRYLLRFETSDRQLYQLIHPPLPGQSSDRLALLSALHELGYEIGSGIMVGLPGQTYASVATDIELFRRLDLDMIGIGPFIAHPATPLGDGTLPIEVPADQIPHDELTALKVVALARLACPEANIPATTALATIDKERGYELALQRGANVIMPDLTPLPYRLCYEIYPGKTALREAGADNGASLAQRLQRLGRRVGTGPGNRQRHTPPAGEA